MRPAQRSNRKVSHRHRQFSSSSYSSLRSNRSCALSLSHSEGCLCGPVRLRSVSHPSSSPARAQHQLLRAFVVACLRPQQMAPGPRACSQVFVDRPLQRFLTPPTCVLFLFAMRVVAFSPLGVLPSSASCLRLCLSPRFRKRYRRTLPPSSSSEPSIAASGGRGHCPPVVLDRALPGY